MKTAEQIAEKLWEKYANDFGNLAMNRDDFFAAISDFKQEYGEAVRQKAAGVCGDEICSCCWGDDAQAAAEHCAAAIERMELP